MDQSIVVNLFNDSFHFIDHLVHTWLQISIIVLNIIDQFSKTPECVSFNSEKLVNTQILYIVQLKIAIF